MESFKELNLSPHIMRAIDEMGFTKPSEIQAEALPVLLGDKTDFLGLAATGTGKTAAYSIPFLEQIDPTIKKAQVLVLCPTRELALQVAGQIDILGKYKGVKALPIYGGSGYREQLDGLRSGMPVVVGTPGRLIDHIEKGTLNLEDISTVVLDEADEMISMGFRDELEKILSKIPRSSSNIWLFSATMSGDVRRVADKYLRKPKQVQINRTEMLSDTVEQVYIFTREGNKPDLICRIIDMSDGFYGIVFCQTKALVMDLTEYLQNQGYLVDCLHGDKDQRARERSMQAFRDKRVNMLICTDVAARGLDVKNVTHVINYTLPRELDSYVHRIGRTARSGTKGYAISLVTSAQKGLMTRIERMTKSRMVEWMAPTRREVAAKKVLQFLPKFVEQSDFSRAVELLDDDWKEALKTMSPEEVAGRFLSLKLPELFGSAQTVPGVIRSAPDSESRRPSRRDERGGGRSSSGGARRGGPPSRSPNGDGRPSRSADSRPRPPRDRSAAPAGGGKKAFARKHRKGPSVKGPKGPRRD